MGLNIEGGHGLAAARDVEALEKKIGAELPMEYREFIINNNGGVPAPDIFDFFDENKGEEDASDVSRFLSVGVKEYESIENYLKVYFGRVPPEYLPIAHDSGGNLILIKFSGEEVGKVCFWDHEYEADAGESPGENNVFCVSKSFDEFLSGLHDIDD